MGACSVPALADSPPSDGAPPAQPTSDGYLEAINGQAPGGEVSLTDPQAAAQLPHRDLSRSDALALLQQTFGSVLQAAAGPFANLEVEKFLSNNVAVIASGDQEAGANEGEPAEPQEQLTLLDSTIPLRALNESGEEEPIDLGLQSAGDALEPENSLVEATLPTELGEGIELPEAEVRIEVQDAPQERSPSTVAENIAFYPNTARDTDFAVAPTPTGVETFTQLRSADAPTTQALRLSLPPGADLVETKGGGAEVTQDGITLVAIHAPSALDASGSQVLVHLDVEGDVLALEAIPPPGTSFPVLVDPIFETYTWGGNTTVGLTDWIGESTPNSPFTQKTMSWCNYWCSGYIPNNLTGLWVAAGEHYPDAPGYSGGFHYVVPRWESDWKALNHGPTSYISAAHYYGPGLWLRGDTNASPYLIAGLWWPEGAQWISTYSRGGNEGNAYMNEQWHFPGANSAKEAIFGMVSSDYHNLSSTREAFIGYITLELSDQDKPSFGSFGTAPQWVNNSPTSTIPFLVSDNGLGVYSATVKDKLGHSWQTIGGCIGGSGSPCPRQWGSAISKSPLLKYDPSVLPQGINNLEATASDPLGHVSSEEGAPVTVRVKVDHTAPTITLSGTMTEQPMLGPTLPQYTLSYEAKDGTSEAPQSGIVSTEVIVDGTKVQSSSAGCSTENCKVTDSWPLESASYAVGKHTVVVKTKDAVGLESQQEMKLQIQRDVTPPELAISGPLPSAPEGWVEQKSYQLTEQAKDLKGSGVTSLSLKIDGKVVKSTTKTCPAGGCEVTALPSVNMAEYSGGEHPAEVVATDGSGNSSKKAWTINVDPKGQIPGAEAIETLEAADNTGEPVAVVPADQVIDPFEIEEGNNPGISGLKSTGTKATSTIAPSPANGFEIGMPEGSTMSVVPTTTAATATGVTVAAGVAGVAANTQAGVDSVVRPIFDGTMVFQSIREASSPAEYSWKVSLESDQTMSLYDEHTAQVFYGDGTPAALIKAEIAHDATGKQVPTSLAVSGTVITLKVPHKNGGFVYPIVAGPVFEVGYRVPEIVQPPPPPPTQQQEAEASMAGMSIPAWEVGPPIPSGPGSSNEAMISTGLTAFHRTFREDGCAPAGCWLWGEEIKGYFWYNGYEAWWKKSQPQPSCAGLGAPWYSFSVNRCEFVGPNHQKYGAGYHITAQLFFDVHTGVWTSSGKHVTVRMFGDGYYKGHDTDQICNPSRPGC